MRAATMKERPSFPLMRQTDVQSIYHMQMPRWLFSDPRYAGMGLEAKVAYTFLLNRFQLSRRNGWVNDLGEVFVIFPRKELARELRICEQKVTAAFRTLKELDLIWEKRCGRGDANQIYLATVTPQDDPDYTSAPFVPPEDGTSRTAGSEVLGGSDFPISAQEPQDRSGKNRETCASRTADIEVPEPQELRPSYKDLSHTYPSHTDVSPSVPRGDGRADGEAELMGILDACELQCFSLEAARVFENAIERLFYADSFRVGKFVRSGSGSEDGRRFPGNLLSFQTVAHTVHPTQKPVELCEYLIKTYTAPGQVVADICAGSGTTAIAALNTGREFICFETAPAFYGPATERITQARAAVAAGGKGV